MYYLAVYLKYSNKRPAIILKYKHKKYLFMVIMNLNRIKK